MVAIERGCTGGGMPNMGCSLGITTEVAWPVFRTIACAVWGTEGCAVHTLHYGWYDDLLNVINLCILIALAVISFLLSRKITARLPSK